MKDHHHTTTKPTMESLFFLMFFFVPTHGWLRLGEGGNKIFSTVSTSLSKLNEINTLNNVVSTKISIFVLKEKVFQDYLETYQISGLINGFLTTPSILNGCYILFSVVLFYYSLIEQENKTKMSKLQKFGISKKTEKQVEIILFVFMMTMTKNVENVS